MKCNRCLYEKMCHILHTPESHACAEFKPDIVLPKVLPGDKVYIERKIRGKEKIIPYNVKCIYMDEYSDRFKYDVYGRDDELLEALSENDFFTEKDADKTDTMIHT